MLKGVCNFFNLSQSKVSIFIGSYMCLVIPRLSQRLLDHQQQSNCFVLAHSVPVSLESSLHWQADTNTYQPADVSWTLSWPLDLSSNMRMRIVVPKCADLGNKGEMCRMMQCRQVQQLRWESTVTMKAST